MKARLIAGATTSLGTVLALIAIVGAGHKWW